MVEEKLLLKSKWGIIIQKIEQNISEKLRQEMGCVLASWCELTIVKMI